MFPLVSSMEEIGAIHALMRKVRGELKAEGVKPWLALLNELDGFQLRLHDWKGEWRCGDLTPERVEEFLRFYTPGEHQLVIDRRWPVPARLGARGAALTEEFAKEVGADAFAPDAVTGTDIIRGWSSEP